METKNKFKKDFIAVFFAKIGFVILKIAMGILIARVLGPFGKGIYVAVGRLSGILSTISSFSIGESLIFFLGRKKIKSLEIVGTSFFISIVCSLLALVVLFVFQDTIEHHFFKEFKANIYWIIYLLIPFTMFNSFVAYALKGLEKFKDYNTLSIIITIVKILLTAFCFYFIAGDYTTALIALIAVSAIQSIWGLILLFRYSMGRFRVSWKNLYPLTRYGLLTHFGSIFDELENQVDIFLLLYFLSPASVGIYSAAWAIASLLQYIANSLNVILFPKISSIPEKEVALDFTHKSIRCLLFICFAASVFIVITAYPLIRICYGAEFIDAFWVTIILLPAMIADVVFRTLFSWFKGTGKPLVTSVFTGLSVLINTFFNILLIPPYGITGAAISAVISYNLRTILLVNYFIKITDSTFRDTIVIKRNEIEIITKWIISYIHGIVKIKKTVPEQPLVKPFEGIK